MAGLVTLLPPTFLIDAPQTGDDVTVLMVTHGQTIGEATNQIVNKTLTGQSEQNHQFSFEGIRNTSVTSFLLPSPTYKYPGVRPNARGEVVKFKSALELFNDTTHLGGEQLRLFFAQQYRGLKAKM
jgi:hypothetical protein